MASSKNEYAKPIFDKIDQLFVDEIGPIAVILCEEAAEQWHAELEAQKMIVNLRHLPNYISLLAQHIDNPQSKNVFLDAVYEIDALKFYRPK